MGRVVITGIGAVTPLGNTFEESWKAAVEGRSGIGTATRFDASSLPWRAAGEVRGFQPSRYLTPKEELHLDPFVHFAVAASSMAVRDAGLAKDDYLEAGGVIIGSSRGGIGALENAILKSHEALAGRKKGRLSPHLMPSTTISAASSFSAWKLGIRGHCLGISNACSSGTNAVGEAYRLIKSGYGGPLLAGGTEAPLCRLCVHGYGSSGALSDYDGPSASRPFDRTRNGFVMSEGACVLAVEDLGQALKRGAKVYAEITGYACGADAFHMTRPDASGEARAIEAALLDAGISAGEIDYISSHGTSTVVGDRTEAEALNMVFGEKAEKVPVSALKSMTGHMLAASGAVETAFSAMSLKTGIIPPTINLEEKDELCRLNVIRNMTEKRINFTVTTSFGFGGVNAVLVLRRYA
ncbi:MAG: beta-ketoacyl-ACP synthase II [Nitrospirae bacterium]|nr:beta-ketoacyl-ACP synthase II [Nitrospirota bacterium]